jgi:hypothetical protein
MAYIENTAQYQKIARNWTNIDKYLTTARKLLNNLSSTNKKRNYIVNAISRLENSLAIVKDNRITRLGNIKIQSSIASSINTLKGVEDDIWDSSKKKIINKYISEVSSNIEKLQKEVNLHINFENQQKITAEYNKQIENIENKAKPKLSKKFNEIETAMLNLKKMAASAKLKEVVKSIIVNIDDTKVLATSIGQYKQEDTINRINSRIEEAERQLINKFRIARKNMVDDYAIFEAKIPIILQTDKPLNRHNIASSGISVDIFTSPDIALGANPGGMRKSGSNSYILYDQLVVGFIPDVDLTTSEVEDKLNIFLDNLISILKSRLGVEYVDVINSVLEKGNKRRTLAWNKTERVRYIWLLERNKLAKLGHFKPINTNLLPFDNKQTNIDTNKLKLQRERREAIEKRKQTTKKEVDESPE